MKIDNIDKQIEKKIDDLSKADDIYINNRLINSLIIILDLKDFKNYIDIYKNKYGIKKTLAILLLYSYYSKTFDKKWNIDILNKIIKG